MKQAPNWPQKEILVVQIEKLFDEVVEVSYDFLLGDVRSPRKHLCTQRAASLCAARCCLGAYSFNNIISRGLI